jgi:hypothetical protein
VIPALRRRLRQEDLEYKATLDYIARSCLKNQNNHNNNNNNNK